MRCHGLEKTVLLALKSVTHAHSHFLLMHTAVVLRRAFSRRESAIRVIYVYRYGIVRTA